MGLEKNMSSEHGKRPEEIIVHTDDEEHVVGVDEAAASHGGMRREMSDSSIAPTEDETDDEEKNIEVGPQYTLKEQLEKDKDDESLRRWKEQLLGSVDLQSVGETLDPDVKILSLTIKSPARPDMVLPIPESINSKGSWFTLKEGSPYSIKVTFQVSNNIVCGLRYTNTVWKTGVKVDSTKDMLGTFSPQAEPYTHEMPEDKTPSGIFARGSYSARTKEGLALNDNDPSFLVSSIRPYEDRIPSSARVEIILTNDISS